MKWLDYCIAYRTANPLHISDEGVATITRLFGPIERSK